MRKLLNTPKKDASRYTKTPPASSSSKSGAKETIRLFAALLLSLSICSSCANLAPDLNRFDGGGGSTFREVDPSLESYVSDFEYHWGQRISFRVKFEAVERPNVGTCTVWTKGGKEVKIDPNYWSGINEVQKEILMFHELGHCALGKGHDDSRINFLGRAGLWPNSVMRSFTFSTGEAEVYDEELTHYINNLFN